MTQLTTVIPKATLSLRVDAPGAWLDNRSASIFAFDAEVTTVEELYTALDAGARHLRATFPLPRVRSHPER
jgi:hypothetical protein